MPGKTSGVPYWIIFIAGLLSALILMLTGIMLGFITIRNIPITTIFSGISEASTSGTAMDTLANWKSYTNTTLGISFKYPPEMTIRESEDGFPIEIITGTSRKYWFSNKGVGGISGIQHDQESFVVGGYDSTLTTYYACSDMIEDWSGCQQKAAQNSYDTTYLEARVEIDTQNFWTIGSASWNKGSLDTDTERNAFKLLLTTVNFK